MNDMGVTLSTAHRWSTPIQVTTVSSPPLPSQSTSVTKDGTVANERLTTRSISQNRNGSSYRSSTTDNSSPSPSGNLHPRRILGMETTSRRRSTPNLGVPLKILDSAQESERSASPHNKVIQGYVRKYEPPHPRVDKKRRFPNPFPNLTGSDMRPLLEANATLAEERDIVGYTVNHRGKISQKNESVASIFRAKSSRSHGHGLRATAAVFTPGNFELHTIHRPEGVSVGRGQGAPKANQCHTLVMDNHQKATLPFSIGHQGSDIPGYYLVSGPDDPHVWASTNLPGAIARSRRKSVTLFKPVVGIPTVPQSHRRPRLFKSYQGFNVTVVDEEHKVFVIDLVAPETCERIRNLTKEHIDGVEEAGDKSKSWRCLYTYTKMDLPCREVASLSKINTNIEKRIVHIVGEVFGQPKAASKLKPRSWKEPHLLLYQKLKGQPEHTGIEMHYDGCDLTWQLMLTDSGEYSGGGTYFRALQKTILLRQGQVLVHPGELYHKGIDITSGTRFLMVCFMDGFCPGIKDQSDGLRDREEFQKHTFMF